MRHSYTAIAGPDRESAFTYEPLPNPSAQIRLLDLQPGPKRSRIECRIRVINVSESKYSYEPLSYFWGDQKNPDIALVNDGQFPIGRNLSRALKQLRDTHRVRPLWVDAICINQGNVQEKNAQIPLMRQIYENGDETIIWLGDSSSWSAHLAFQYMLKDAIRHDRIIRSQPEAGGEAERRHEYQDSNEAWSVRSGGNFLSRYYWRWRDDWKFVLGDRALRKMLTSDWFTRVWVVQEVAVSERATIYWGGVCGNWNLLEDAYPFFPRQLDKTPTLKNLILQRIAYHSSEKPENLAFAASLASAANATDVRDKIYAVMGLADPDTTSQLITVDYNIPPVELFTNFTRTYLEQFKDPGILAHAVGCDQQGSIPMPSWTFRPTSEPWHTLRNGLYAWDYDGTYSRLKRPRFQCSRSSSFSPAFEDDGKRLGLFGYQIDTVASTAEVLRPTESLRRTRLDKVEFRHAITYLRWRAAVTDMGDSYRDSNESVPDVLRSVIYSTFGDIPETDRDALVQCEAYVQKRLGLIAEISPEHNRIAWFCGYIMCGLLHVSREAGLLDYDFRNMPTFMPCVNRLLMKTGLGYLGVASSHARAGDAIVLVAGSRAPFVMRKTGQHYKIVSDCYIHGIMEGEAWDEGKCDTIWIE